MTKKLGRNELCWCGSGKKYKKCHLGRADERPVPLPALSGTLGAFFKSKQCLHPLASKSTCGKVVAAHTVQAKGPLSTVLDDSGHCLSFYPPTGDDKLPKRIGWRRASTFLGFCSRHDGPTFAPVENADFVGSDEQVFLLAYRAECHELFQKQASHKSQETLRQLLDRGKDETLQRMIQSAQYWQGQGVAKGLEDARRRKAHLDRQLLDRKFGGFRRVFLTSNCPMSVVSTGSVTPNRTLSGTSLQTLHNPAAQIESLYVAFVQDDSRHAVMLAWREEDKAPAAWVDEFISMPLDRMAGAIVQWLFAYVENTYFSQTWWESLSDDQQRGIRALAQEGNPYYNHPKYMDDLSVPWMVSGVSSHWMQPG